LIATQKNNQPAIAYPINTTSDRPSKNKSTSDRLSIPIISDRPSKKLDRYLEGDYRKILLSDRTE
jgi:hypothetical protein